MSFTAIYLTNPASGFKAELRSLTDADLPSGDVLVEVSHSSINYKDALAVTKGAPVVRQFPMVPGIDLAGTVRESTNPAIKVGESVMVNGRGMGEQRWGGFSQRQRISADMITKIPAPFTPADAMAIGTAGYTAALCLLTLERGGLKPENGDVLVTGSTGGVGSFAVALLAARGYRVTAST